MYNRTVHTHVNSRESSGSQVETARGRIFNILRTNNSKQCNNIESKRLNAAIMQVSGADSLLRTSML